MEFRFLDTIIYWYMKNKMPPSEKKPYFNQTNQLQGITNRTKLENLGFKLYEKRKEDRNYPGRG